MRNSLYSGNNVTLPAPYALTSGQVAQVGSIIGVAQAAAAISADVVLVRQGVFTLTKTAAQAGSETMGELLAGRTHKPAWW